MNMDHVRIDEGVKRGKRTETPSLPKNNGHHTGLLWHVPDGVDPDDVLKQYLSEERTAGIAARIGCTRSALTAWLREVRPLEWQRVQQIRAHAAKEKHEDGIEDASDAISLARARERLRAAQWDLSRVDRAIYGDQPLVNVAASGNVQINIVSYAASQQDAPNQAQVIDSTSKVVDQ